MEDNSDSVYCCRTPKDSVNFQAGHAVDYCEVLDDGMMVVGNGEYETQVNFCPFCGKRAQTQIGE